MKDRKILLNENEIPENWYNIIADMPNKPLPPLHPGTKEPIGPDALAPLFPMELIKQEVTSDILDGKNSVVLKQAKNRMYIQQAILIYVLKK